MRTAKYLRLLGFGAILALLAFGTYLSWEVYSARQYTSSTVLPNYQSTAYPLALADLSPRQIEILLKVEDPRFHEHCGVDLATPGAGITTITQDVEDFLSVDLGKTIIQNSSLQILLKQSSAAIDRVAELFFLSEGEKQLLLSANIGEGLFFAGPAHAAIRIISSPQEHAVITTNPKELADQKTASDAAELAANESHSAVAPPVSPAANRPIYTVETVKNGQ